MTNELIELYSKALCEEQAAFITYKHILKKEALSHSSTSEVDTHKTLILTIIGEEIQHYETIHKILFGGLNGSATPIETAYRSFSEDALADMKACLIELKKM